MPYQVGVTIRAEVGAFQVPPLQKWLADVARQGLAEPPFDFAHLAFCPSAILRRAAAERPSTSE